MNSLLRITIIQIFLLIATTLSAQQQTITVGAGETFESIANRYGLTLEELLEANPGKYECYAGMKIIVPSPYESPVGNKDISSVVILHADSLLLAAKAKSSNGAYRKAIKTYNKVLAMKVRDPYAYAGRGECYFNLKKYKKAKKDLTQAIYSHKLATIEKEWCESALEDINDALLAKRERRKEVWANIGLTFATAAALTATAYMASEQSKAQKQYYRSSMPYRTSGSMDRANQIIAHSDANINMMMARNNAQLNMMTQQTIRQVQQAKERMNQAFRDQIEWAGEFNKEHGRYPTEYEIDQWYSVHYPDLLESRILARGKMTSTESSEEKEKGNEYTGDLSPSQYQESYKRYEHLAEMWFSNLTTGGVKYEDKNGNIKGITSSDMTRTYVGNQMGLKDAQREMRKIRTEAAKHGVHIAESKWETATSRF